MVGITGAVTVNMPEVLVLQMWASILCYVSNFKSDLKSTQKL